ncbi:MAG: MoaD/ThiS family protein [Candidatus Hadarchaeum sp.]|uniref:MoaD/ThiS family protein n=1 Tax=Candidatus Hadarchaeum sp. TaxID=2883567 RepID=UPI003D0ED6A4
MRQIEVSVVYLSFFQEITKTREEKLKVQEGATLRDLLELLCAKHGESFRKALFDPKTGAVYGHNHITLNGRLAHLVDKNFRVNLGEGDRVALAHAVSGG